MGFGDGYYRSSGRLRDLDDYKLVGFERHTSVQ